jgi:hypothetical protein
MALANASFAVRVGGRRAEQFLAVLVVHFSPSILFMV